MKMSGLCGRLRFPVVQARQPAEVAQKKRYCGAGVVVGGGGGGLRPMIREVHFNKI